MNETFTQIESTVDSKDSLLTLIDLDVKKKVINKNSGNSLELCEKEEGNREVTESPNDIKSVFEERRVQKHSENKENSCESQWNQEVEENKYKDEDNDECQSIQEVVVSDFLTSPADGYPNRRVELEDAVISEETKENFTWLCDKYKEVFSKNNQDIGKTTLIEMEIDTGDNLPVAQSLYTLPLKHYEWVQKEIKTLQKAGVIVKSLLPWPSPVIVVLKKSTPD